MSQIFKRRRVEYDDEYKLYLSLPLSDQDTNPLEW